MRNTFLLVVLFSSLIVTARARADYYIVVNADNPQAALTSSEALNIYMGRSRAFSNGGLAVVFDLSRDSPKREGFYRALTGLSLAQITSYWARLVFSGRTLPPQAVPDEAAMVRAVSHNANALGWLSSAPTDKALHTVLVLKEQM